MLLLGVVAAAPAQAEDGLSHLLKIDLGSCEAPAAAGVPEPVLLLTGGGCCDCTTDADCNFVCVDGGLCLDGRCTATTTAGCDCSGTCDDGGDDEETGEPNCDDCHGGCSILCSSNFDCASQCDSGSGLCMNDGRCVCNC